MFGLRPIHPTLLRKTMGSLAFNDLTEAQRRRIANHMTHRPGTALKAYSAKNKPSHALETVSAMHSLVYEEGEEGNCHGESTVPSSAGAMARLREPFNEQQLAILDREAHRLYETGRHASMNVALLVMVRYKPTFDNHLDKQVLIHK